MGMAIAKMPRPRNFSDPSSRNFIDAATSLEVNKRRMSGRFLFQERKAENEECSKVFY
jgi:hypothetical protein